MRRRPGRLVAIALSGLFVLTGCGDDGDDAPTLEATASRSSLFDSRRTFRLELVNEGDRPLTVDTIQLRSPLFVELAPSVRDTQLAVGQRLLLPLPYGESICPGAGPLELVAVVDDRDVVVPLAQDPDGVVDAHHERECAEAAVHQALDLRFSRDWTVTGPTMAAGAIVADSRAGSSATIGSVEGNIIFRVRFGPGADRLEVRPGAGSSRLPLEVVVTRCDVHALVESKRTFEFPMEVRLDGADPVRVVLEPEGPTRDLFQSLIEACIG